MPNPRSEAPAETGGHLAVSLGWRFLRSLLVLILSAALLSAGVLFAYNTVKNNLFTSVSETDDTPILVEIPRGSSISVIGKRMEEAGVVKNGKVFKYYIQFSGYASKMKAGTYVLNATMSMRDIMEKLAQGDGRGEVTTFLTVEGLNVKEIAASLKTQGVISSEEEFLELCRDTELFSYNFAIAALSEEELEGRTYALEGYLFPAKYEIYVDSSMETIIEKMLSKFTSVMNEERLERAAELGFSVDEVITLASVIEKEAKTEDFAKVSAVFHNRLERGMRLQSDATVQYVLGTSRYCLTGDDIAVESLYNTYLVDGLPVGPICCPSEKAIDAALYPDETYVDEAYLFFAAGDPETGELIFSKNQEDHESAVEEYRPLWEAYDEKMQQAED